MVVSAVGWLMWRVPVVVLAVVNASPPHRAARRCLVGASWVAVPSAQLVAAKGRPPCWPRVAGLRRSVCRCCWVMALCARVGVSFHAFVSMTYRVVRRCVVGASWVAVSSVQLVAALGRPPYWPRVAGVRRTVCRCCWVVALYARVGVLPHAFVSMTYRVAHRCLVGTSWVTRPHALFKLDRRLETVCPRRLHQG